MTMGWQCPRCRNCWGPFVAACSCNTVSVPETPWGPIPGCDHAPGEMTTGGVVCRKCGAWMPPPISLKIICENPR